MARKLIYVQYTRNTAPLFSSFLSSFFFKKVCWEVFLMVVHTTSMRCLRVVVRGINLAQSNLLKPNLQYRKPSKPFHWEPLQGTISPHSLIFVVTPLCSTKPQPHLLTTSQPTPSPILLPPANQVPAHILQPQANQAQPSPAQQQQSSPCVTTAVRWTVSQPAPATQPYQYV